MKVMIVSRTRMSTRRCVGALSDSGDSLRILTSAGDYWPTASCPFRVGELWEIDFSPAQSTQPPHVEDVCLTQHRKIGSHPDPAKFIRQHDAIWYGGIDAVFDGLLRFTGSGNGYICSRVGLPGRSTGFWKPDQPLTKRSDGVHFDYLSGRGMKYVGEPASPDSLAAGQLLRVSLAKWWAPDDADVESRCYLQLSGWY